MVSRLHFRRRQPLGSGFTTSFASKDDSDYCMFSHKQCMLSIGCKLIMTKNYTRLMVEENMPFAVT